MSTCGLSQNSDGPPKISAELEGNSALVCTTAVIWGLLTVRTWYLALIVVLRRHSSISFLTVYIQSQMNGTYSNSCCHQPRLVCCYPCIKGLPEVGNNGLVDVSSMWINLFEQYVSSREYLDLTVRINLELHNIPIFDFCIWWVIGPRNINAFD